MQWDCPACTRAHLWIPNVRTHCLEFLFCSLSLMDLYLMRHVKRTVHNISPVSYINFFYRCLSTFYVCTASVWLFVQPAAILGQNRPRAIHTGYVFCETLTSMNINPRCPVDCPGTQYRGRFSLLCGNSCAKGSSDGPQTIQDWYTKEANCFTSSAWTNVRCDISAPLVFRCKSKSCYAQCNASHNSADKA